MYVILSYDINKKRVGRVLKTCRKYLIHNHKSVFEGHLTEAELEHLKAELDHIIKPQQDAVCIYRVDYEEMITKLEIGQTVQQSNII